MAIEKYKFLLKGVVEYNKKDLVNSFEEEKEFNYPLIMIDDSIKKGILEDFSQSIIKISDKFYINYLSIYYEDNNEDNFSDSNWQVFEMGRIIEDPKATAPILSYLFHRIEVEKLTKDYLTAIVVDEAWFAMENESFRLKFNDWLRTLAKLNAFIIFATQSLDEIAKSEITPAIVDGCKTKILLPSPQAKNYWKELYSKFGLNTIEIEKVARGEMQKQYFYKSDLGSREFEMDLGKIELAYVGSASSTDQIKIQEICAETNDLKEINLKWLEYKLGKNSQEFRRCKEIIQGGN